MNVDQNQATFISNIISTFLPLASLKCDVVRYENLGSPKEDASTLDIPLYDTRMMGVWQFYGTKKYSNKEWNPLVYTFNSHGSVGLPKSFMCRQCRAGSNIVMAPALSSRKLIRDSGSLKEGHPNEHDVMLHPGHHQDIRLLIIRWISNGYQGNIKIYCRVCRPLYGSSDGVGLSIWKDKTQIFPIQNGNEDNFCTYDKPTEIEINCEINAGSTIDLVFDPLGTYYSDQSQLELFFMKR